MKRDLVLIALFALFVYELPRLMARIWLWLG